MPQILTTHALIICPHGGIGKTQNTSVKWTIDGGFVALDGDPGTLSCIFLPPCVGYTLQSMGLNATQIDGRNVMLETDFTKSITGLPLVIKETHQVFDNTTHAPIPYKQAAPPLPPAMTDLIKPVVKSVGPPMIFSKKTPLPVTANFTLVADYPMQWILTLIDEPPPGGHMDLTNGVPPQVIVSPSGGNWTTPSLSVNVTMMVPFLTGLNLGEHQLYMTGVSQRGLSGFDKAKLTVGA
jgi:hypothetical protein